MAGAGVSTWKKSISKEGNIRAIFIEAREVIEELCTRHGLGDRSSEALGEACLAALSLASYCKAGEKINFQIKSDTGWAKSVVVDATPEGTLRGYILESEQEAGEDRGPWGEGVLSILRGRPLLDLAKGWERPYIGNVPLLTGHLAKDLSFYWYQSEQVPSAVGISVKVVNRKVEHAGAFLIQTLPGASDEEVKHVEAAVQSFDSFESLLREGASASKVFAHIFGVTPFMLLEDSEIRFECSCSEEKVMGALELLGKEDLQAMIDEDGGASVNCDFCSSKYEIKKSELQKIFKQKFR